MNPGETTWHSPFAFDSEGVNAGVWRSLGSTSADVVGFERPTKHPDNDPVLSHPRREIESDIGVYSRAIVDLRSRLNSLTYIGRLPPELLSEILVCVAMDAYFSTVRPGAPGYWYNRLSWIRLSYVCRLFRSVALGTPRFWSYLRLVKSSAFQQLLARSRSAPLYITGHVNYSIGKDRLPALVTLLQHSHRLREFRIEASCRLLQNLCSEIVSPLKVLEKLVLKTDEGYYGDFATTTLVPVVASIDVAPRRLRHLELYGLPFSWSDPVLSFPCFTSLIITGKSATSRRHFFDVGTLAKLLTALEGCAHCLENLELDEVFPPMALTSPDNPSLPPPSRLTPFPSLKNVRFVSDSFRIAYVLNHMSLPPATSLNLVARNPAGIDELMRTLWTHTSRGDPLAQVKFRAPSGPDPLTLYGWRGPIKSSQQPLFQVSFAGYTLVQNTLPDVVQHSQDIFAPVETLRLSGGFFALTKWADIFVRFPSVRTLILDEHAWSEFFTGLMTPLRAQNGAIYPPLPALTTVKLAGFRFFLPQDNMYPFDELLDWMIFRCNYGCPVDKITLRSCRHANHADVQLLKGVVVDVDWDEEELGDTTDEDAYDSDQWPGSSEDTYFGYRYGYGEY
ncbi:hypothetical protein C8Q77DRAFT_229285 [Trametes polyzona]|nr:hypothetical protein C8Q77DRAFT_229285 [Trametes polyzona]